ncbi:hypothetical protein SAMN05660772_02739 [Pasteurella testudinis DSM 23072]|uniref:Uncharacterized protein n=1 Tax=Pasteurella testudinis DSM 23072 TaxID=1122938 RepID=A0A1W1V363_9PAST|nr:hypothetical protein [Pasteurella testudinis]SMB87799.1 hypothetical protein SAMN05660772_02739 [Pasteurella testudinis DSM 23072]SUB51595.1 Uncharacterised protein [Pasteurella testudinis]
MPKFIKLTQKDMDSIHFNIDHISAILDNDSGACVTTTGCDETYYIVKETPEQILELIRAAE